MVNYCVIPAARLDREGVYGFVKEFDEEATLIGNVLQGDEQWSVPGPYFPLFVSVSEFHSVYYTSPSEVMRYLGVSLEPVVVVISTRSGNPLVGKFITAFVECFGGIVDYDGQIVWRIVDGDTSDVDAVLKQLRQDE